MSVTPELECIDFPETYAYVLVESKETKEIFYLPMNGGFVGFIESITCDWYEGSSPPVTRSVLELIVDGVPRKFEYEIQINKPYVFNPPIIVRNYIRWRVTNNDIPYTADDGTEKNGAHYYGVRTEGRMCRPKIL